MNPQRRHHGIKRAERVLRVWCATCSSSATLKDNDEYRLKLAQVMLRTRVLCSSSCCGNPRKWRKQKTHQEIKADDSFREQLVEL